MCGNAGQLYFKRYNRGHLSYYINANLNDNLLPYVPIKKRRMDLVEQTNLHHSEKFRI